jgi:hypothetical protein
MVSGDATNASIVLNASRYCMMQVPGDSSSSSDSTRIEANGRILVRGVLRTALIVSAVVIVVAVVGLGLVLSHGSPTSAPAAVASATSPPPSPLCADWAIIPLDPGYGAPDLSSVAAIATNDVWAVGTSGDTQGIAVHWNGSAWTRYQTPSQVGKVYLRGVAAASATDVWAVGSIVTGQFSSTALVEHWDGSQWSVAATSDVTAGQQNFLSGVAVVTSSDVWAVGTTGLYNTEPLILHWNGAAWSDVSGRPRHTKAG